MNRLRSIDYPEDALAKLTLSQSGVLSHGQATLVKVIAEAAKG